MTTVTLLIQRCMVILAIFLCYVQARGDNLGERELLGRERKEVIVDCERYPFHYTCRGKMSRKRTMQGNTIHGLGCDGARGDFDCVKYKNFVEKQRRIPHFPLPRSRLWIGLVGDMNDLQKESPYEAYRPKYGAHHEKRKSDEPDLQYDDRRIPLTDDLFPEVEVSDNDY